MHFNETETGATVNGQPTEEKKENKDDKTDKSKDTAQLKLF